MTQQHDDAGTTELSGTPVVGGVVFGPGVRAITSRPDPGPDAAVPEDGRAAEADRFTAAAGEVAAALRARAGAATGVAAEVLSATAGMAEDRGWAGAVTGSISSGVPAPHAVIAATETITAMFRKAGGLMAERVTDLEDVRDRVVARLVGAPEPGVPVPGTPSVLIADDLAPADTAGLVPETVLALVTERGGPTSHTAIIARQLGIPCVVAVAGALALPEGEDLLVDATAGTVVRGADPARARARAEAWLRERDRVADWSGPAATADGRPVALLANVQDGDSARAAAADVAEGVGLMRTELTFLDRDSAPTVDEQAGVYTEVLAAFPGRKVVIRTLDAGSDKPLRFVDHGREENPALGVRGIRISRTHPELVTGQLDAIARAAAARADTSEPVQVMAPMIATVAEAREFAVAARSRGLSAGVMIEVPSTALQITQICAEVDFVSIGTNDLTQYVMAADRMSADLAELTDPWQPAVLGLIGRVAAAGRDSGTPVGVCGEAAADPLLACVLVGLGVDSLSAAVTALRPVGAALGGVSLDRCRRAADAAMAAAGPGEARAAARAALEG